MHTFKYIHKPDYPHDLHDVLDNYYDSDSILDTFVIHDMAIGKYYVFDSPAAYMEFFNATPGPKSFNEVIFGNMPQKLKFDIDAPVEAVKDTGADFKTILQHIVDAIINAFYIQYNEDIEYNDIIFCKSMDVLEPKFSFHLIINRSVPNSTTASIFTDKVISYIPDKYRKFLDKGVNKSLQNFRLVGCVKPGSVRVKTLVSPGYTPIDSFITTPGAKLMPEIKSRHAEKTINVHHGDIKAILNLCEEVTIGHKFRSENNGVILFNRIRPSHCNICDRVHSNENSLVIFAEPLDGMLKCSYSCRRDQTKSRVYIGEIQSSIGSGSSWTSKHLQTAVDAASGAGAVPAGTLFDTLPNKHIYSNTALDKFPIADTLCVHAGMKMGKTKALVDYIDTHFKDTVTERVIRFISFRQTFSMNIKERFAGFQLYSDIKGDLTQPKLIVQVESLHRLVPCDSVDLVILDECESIFEQFDSGLLRNFNGAFAIFQWLLKYAKHVVCMDAYLSDRTYNILKRMRPGFESDKTIYYHNVYKNAADDTFHMTSDKGAWLTSLYKAIDNGDKIAIPISSLYEAKTIYNTISTRYQDKKVKLYSSETTGNERKDHFGDVNTYWKLYDIIIYTPTVSAGVSFEEKHFDKVYGYFVDQSCPAETCIQMIGRIRNVGTKQLYVYLQGSGGNLPTEIQLIKEYVYKSRESLYKSEANLLIYEFGPNGEVKYYDNDYFTIWLENTRVKNISKNSFVRHFIDLVAQTGAVVLTLKETPDSSIIEEHSIESKNVSKAKIHNIIHAPDISDEDYEAIKLKLASGEEVTHADRCAYTRYRLREDYRYYGELTEKFVTTYIKPGTKRIYKNLTRMHHSPLIEDSLEEIRKYELTNYMYAMENETTQYTDINRRYVYDQHRVAIGFLKACGISHLNDTKYINELSLVANLRRNEDAIKRNLDIAYKEFGLRNVKIKQTGDDGAYLSQMLNIVNKAINTMYGARIISPCANMYQLQPCKLFSYKADDIGKPSIV